MLLLLSKILKISLNLFLVLLILKFINSFSNPEDTKGKHLENGNDYIKSLNAKYEEKFVSKILSYNSNLEEKKCNDECNSLFTPALDTHLLLNESNSNDFHDYSGNLVIENGIDIVNVDDNDIKIKIGEELDTLVFKDVLEDADLFSHEPSIYDIRQGDIGDCWILSSLISICNADSSIIKNSMKDLGNGYVIVKLYKKDLNGCTPCYYKIKKSIPAEKPYVSNSSLWVQLLEKAIFMHISILDSSKGECYFDLQKSILARIINLFLEEDINLLTFYSPNKPIFSNNCDKFIYKIIKKNIKDNIPIVAGTSCLSDNTGILTNHAYSVLGTGKMTNIRNNRKNYYILLANPHGENVTQYYYDYDKNTIKSEIIKRSQHSGIMWVELNHFMNTFEILSYRANKGNINNPANTNDPLFYQTKIFGAYFIKLIHLKRDKNIVKTTFEVEGLYKGFHDEQEKCLLMFQYFQLLYKDGSSETCHWNTLGNSVHILENNKPGTFEVFFRINPNKEPCAIRFCVYDDPSISSIYFSLNDLK